MDKETGLYNFPQRYYDSRNVKWLTLDPIGPMLMTQSAGFVESLNWFSYCNNNPVMYTDPTGMWTFSVGYSAMGGAGGGGQVSTGLIMSFSFKSGLQFGGYGSVGAGAFVSTGGDIAVEWGFSLNKNIKSTSGVTTGVGFGIGSGIGAGGAINLPGYIEPGGGVVKFPDCEPVFSGYYSLKAEPGWELHWFQNVTAAAPLIQIGGEKKEAPLSVTTETLIETGKNLLNKVDTLKNKVGDQLKSIGSKFKDTRGLEKGHSFSLYDPENRKK